VIHLFGRTFAEYQQTPINRKEEEKQELNKEFPQAKEAGSVRRLSSFVLQLKTSRFCYQDYVCRLLDGVSQQWLNVCRSANYS
jgi:hypothetical protein